MSYSYQVFGLSLESDIACPELWPAPATESPDVVMRHGDVPESLEHADAAGAGWQTAPGAYLLKLSRVGRFLVRRGREIVAQPLPGMAEESVRLYMLTAGLSVALLQRQLFVLHCSAIRAPGGAVLFAGNSGTGKSTMVAAFLERGYGILSDDMLALSVDARGLVMALPGFPQLKLWADSAAALKRPTEGWRRVPDEHDKFISSEITRFDPTPSPVQAMYFLQIHDSPDLLLEPMSHTPRFNALLDNAWQQPILGGLGLLEWHFQTAARIASLAYAARLTRPRSTFEIDKMTDLVESDVRLGRSPG